MLNIIQNKDFIILFKFRRKERKYTQERKRRENIDDNKENRRKKESSTFLFRSFVVLIFKKIMLETQTEREKGGNTKKLKNSLGQ